MGSSNSTATDKIIFILSGQSNMVGRGGVINHKWNRIVPPECFPDPQILRFNARNQWEEAREPLHGDIDTKICGVGPGFPFAHAVRAAEEELMVGLVPCAVGGTAITQWERGSHLYQNMVRRSKAAVKEGGQIKALLWYQGESDTDSEHSASLYKHNMEKLIRNVREDLDMPSLPIIQVAIASGNGRFIQKVRKAQLEIKLPNVVTIDAKGLPLNEDHLHLTTDAQVQLGKMLAEAYLKNFTRSRCCFDVLIDYFFPNQSTL